LALQATQGGALRIDRAATRGPVERDARAADRRVPWFPADDHIELRAQGSKSFGLELELVLGRFPHGPLLKSERCGSDKELRREGPPLAPRTSGNTDMANREA